MNLITLEEMKDASVNFALAEEKNMIKGNNYSLYQSVYDLYQRGIDSFLLKNTNIQEYNQKIKNSDLDFGIMPTEKRHKYHKRSYLNLDYLYVRNFLYIEKLPLADLSILINKIASQDFNIDDQVLAIVSRSYKEVIVNNYRNKTYVNGATTCYGHMIPSNIVPSNHLVFNLQYGKNNKAYDREEFYINQKAKDKFLETLVKEMTKDLKDKLNVEITILIRTFVGE